jgi:glutathione S-transferase
MIDLYYWPTPIGHKITLFLEEAALDYTIKPLNISAGDQFDPKFLAFSPNNRMPAIIDHDPADHGEPVTVFESGAILLYLAEKTGLFLPTDLRGRKTVTEWLFWQVAWAPWPGRTITSASMRRRKSPMRSTGTSMRPSPSKQHAPSPVEAEDRGTAFHKYDACIRSAVAGFRLAVFPSRAWRPRSRACARQ